MPSPEEPAQAEQDHRYAEELSHCRPSPKETEVGVRLAEKFDTETKNAVEKKEGEEGDSSGHLAPVQKPEDGKEDRPLKNSFVKLAWMAGQRTTGGKKNAPGKIGNPAVKFTIDKIADPAEPKADGGGGNDNIASEKRRQLVAPAKNQSGNDDSQQATVKTHPSLPDCKGLQGMAQVKRKVIKKNVSQTTAEDHPKNAVKKEIGKAIPTQWQIAPTAEMADDKEAGGKTEKVHDSVPAYRKRSDAYDHGIKLRIGDHLWSSRVRVWLN